MWGDNKISARQLLVCIYLAVSAEMLIKPFREPIRFPAQVLLPAAAFNLLLVGLLLWPLQQGIGERGWLAVPARGLTAALLLLSAGVTVNEANGFLGFTGEWQLPFFLFLLLVLGLIYYAVRLGSEGFARVGGVLLVLFLGSILLIAVSNLQDLRLENLDAGPLPVWEIGQAMQKGFYLSPAFLAGAVLTDRVADRPRLRWKGMLVAVFATYALFALLSELVLGGFAWSQRQPVYTLARIGSLSVFRRLDSLHASIWLMALLLKLILETAAAERLIRGFLPQRGKRYSVLLSVLLVAGVSLVLHAGFPQGVFRWMTWGGVAAAVLLALAGKGEKR